MYLQHFHLQEAPFSIAPNPRYLYLGKRHQEALAHLVFGLRGEGGIVLLTGEVGTGKTTISRKLLEDIPEQTDLAWVVNPKLSVEELLATICDELAIAYPADTTSIKTFTDLINRKLLATHAAGRNTVLMIDEAQNLSPEVLEQLRLLTNLETSERKLLQIVLLGQDELKEMLERHDMRQLAQRITARYHLKPLTLAETTGYIGHRLSIAGSKRKLFTRSAVKKIHQLSRGIPRLINLLCDRALLGAFSQEKHLVEARHIRQAAREVFGQPDTTPWLRPAMLGMAVILPVLILAVFWKQPTTAELIPPHSAGKRANSDTPAPLPPTNPAPTQAKASENRKSESTADPWADISRMGSEQLAYQAVLQRWQPDEKLATGMLPCKTLGQMGLACLQRHGNWGTLRSLNRPAVIRFTYEGKDHYAALTALQGRTATLQLGNQQWQLKLDDIARHWHGEFTLLWRTPPGFTDTLRPGDKGKAVTWLAEQLNKVQGQLIPARSGDTMDTILVSRVRDFQRNHGLNPDGAAGPLTLMRLNDILQRPVSRLLSADSAASETG